PIIIPDRFWGFFAAYAIYRTPAKPLMILSQMILFLALSEIGILPENEKTARMVYKEQFRSKMSARSSKRLVKQSAVWGHGNRYSEPVLGERDTTPFYRFIQDNIGKCWGAEGQNIGVRYASGRWDPLGKDSVIEQWLNELPQLRDNIKIFKGVGHFVEEIQSFRNALLSGIIDSDSPCLFLLSDSNSIDVLSLNASDNRLEI
ncbi:MAG: hypothetical protein JRF40_10350, partial [Deltaproteobacteria bacterium]|nr:hypothetical protein [Deltaproteobacteria bacterium]